MFIVITELAFAFGVGISCVVFSFNLVKAVRRENGEGSQASGSQAGSETGYHTFARTTASSGNDTDILEDIRDASSNASDLSAEGEAPEPVEESELTLLDGALRNFTDYLRVW